MSQSGLGIALRMLREKREFSLREVSKLSDIDHAYVYRLETGEKTNPSMDVVEELLKVLKPAERDGLVVKWLVDHSDTSPELVEYVLKDPSIELDVFTVAAGARHRTTNRPDPATLIARAKKYFFEDDEES